MKKGVAAALLVVCGAALAIRDGTRGVGALLLGIGAWLGAYILLVPDDYARMADRRTPYRLLRNFEARSVMQGRLFAALVFVLISYGCWMLTDRVLGSFLLTVAAFSAGAAYLSKKGAGLKAGDVAVILLLLFGAVYSFIRGL